MNAHEDQAAAEAAVAEQQHDDGQDEIVVPKEDWQRWSIVLQEAVNFARYDLLEPPEAGRGKLIIARKRSKRGAL